MILWSVTAVRRTRLKTSPVDRISVALPTAVELLQWVTSKPGQARYEPWLVTTKPCRNHMSVICTGLALASSQGALC